MNERIPDGYKLTYVVQSEAWYARAVTDPGLSVVLAARDGGCMWEFQFQPYEFSRGSKGVQLRIFDDAFEAFAMIPEFFEAIQSERPASLADVRQILDRIGALDATERQQGHAPKIFD